ncbi:MAG: hypothetical protein WA906_02060, partial [Pacificimonas sp.]
TYPLINAASLAVMGGNGERARELAQLTLERLDDPATEPDTAYYVEATRAEAQLLLGETAKARETLKAAIAALPAAFEDHATTLRQFGMLLGEMGLSDDWLDALRPPPTLHFAGHMDVGADDEVAAAKIRAAVHASSARFGYGALAAGADIVVAEALLAEGAELHVVLPDEPERFRDRSVTVRSGDWAARYDYLIENATSVTSLALDCDGRRHMLAVRLAGDVAMGMAAQAATVIETTASQLLILRGHPDDDGGLSGDLGRAWKAGGRAQTVVRVDRARDGQQVPSPSSASGKCADLDVRLAATVEVDLLDRELTNALMHDAQLAERFAALGRPLASPCWLRDRLAFAHDSPAKAVEAARLVTEAAERHMEASALRFAFDYGIVERVAEPVGGTPFLMGESVEMVDWMLGAVPTGARYMTGSFFHALAARSSRVDGELMGELARPAAPNLPPIELYALKG